MNGVIKTWTTLAVFVFLTTFGQILEAKTNPKIDLDFGKIPLRFEANTGQVDSKAQFLSRGKGYKLFLSSNESVVILNRKLNSNSIKNVKSPDKASPEIEFASVHMKLLDSNPSAKFKGEKKSITKSNYFRGSDPSKWRQNNPNFGKVRYESVYPKIDLVYYGNNNKLEYDFIVNPGGDYNAIQMAFDGVNELLLDPNGNLILSTKTGNIIQNAPIIYQMVEGEKILVAGNYELVNKNQVRFKVDKYNKAIPLIIDPILEFSTYLGGSGGDDSVSMTLDNDGNIYVTGQTNSSDFPIEGAYQNTYQGGSFDVFITKLNPDATEILYSTYLGGSVRDGGWQDLTVDDSGNIFIAGSTDSNNFPLLDSLFPKNGGLDAFLTKIDPTGSILLFSTLIGGSSDERIFDVILDSSNNVLIAGKTWSSNYPILNALQPNFGGVTEIFLSRFSLDDGEYTLDTSTYYGGNHEDRPKEMILDSQGYLYMTGDTGSTNFPTVNGYQDSIGEGFVNGRDFFLLKLSPDLQSVSFATYLGGNQADMGESITLDEFNNIYVTGSTWGSSNLPIKDAFQDSFNGGNNDCVLAKFDTDGNLLFSSYFGGSASEECRSIRLDSVGQIYISGLTNSSNIPMVDPIQDTVQSFDGFLVRFNADISEINFSTYIGGTGGDSIQATEFNSYQDLILFGNTNSSDFPVVSATQSTLAGNSETFIAKIGHLNIPPYPWVAKAPLTRAMSQHFLEAAGGFIYSGQGVTQLGTATNGEVYKYDIEKDEWSFVNRPSLTYGRACTSYQEKIYCFGGIISGGPHGNSEILDPETDTWSGGLQPTPTPRTGAKAARIGDKVYVLGGANAPNQNEVYDISEDEWTSLMPMPNWPAPQKLIQVLC